MTHALLFRAKLNELVGALNIRGTVVQRPGSGGGTCETFGMFMIDMHGTREFATAFISSGTPEIRIAAPASPGQ
jgi:hypothetical protein